MPSPVIIKAKDKDGVYREISITDWSKRIPDWSRSHFSRVINECKEEGMNDQEAIDFMYLPKEEKPRRTKSHTVISGSSVADEKKENKWLKVNAEWWRFFNFERAPKLYEVQS